MEDGKYPSCSQTEAVFQVEPQHTNAAGNLHGGYLLYWMDATGGIAAQRHSRSIVVTVAISNVFFKKPIKLGDIVIIKAKPTRAFNTSIEVKIEVFVEKLQDRICEKTNIAYFTYVCIDKSGKPQKIIPVIPKTDEEKKEYEEALKRREFNLSQSNY